MESLEAVGHGLTSLFTKLHLVFRFLTADVDDMQFSIIDKPLKARNMIIGKVELLKVDQSLQTLHFDNLVALQLQHFQLGKVTDVLYLVYVIAVEMEVLELRNFLQLTYCC